MQNRGDFSMPLEPIRGTQGLASLLLADVGDGHTWGESLMNLTNSIRSGNMVYDHGFARLFG